MKRKFRTGDLIEVKCVDPTGCINNDLSELHLTPCTTRGTVYKQSGNELVLWTSLYPDREGDATAIDVRSIESCRVLVRKEELV